MNFVVVGTNHKYSSLRMRERISFSTKSMKNAFSFLRTKPNINGTVILSTCNRIEIYATVNDAEDGIKEIKDFISFYHEIDKPTIAPCLYSYVNGEALRHLLYVACGLDSLILGETQIQGQVKNSFTLSGDEGCLDSLLWRISEHTSFLTGAVHKSTRISEGKVSVGSVAVDFIKQRIGNLSNKNIMVIGMGKVSELVVKYLKNECPSVIFVSNRTYDKAKALAEQVGARAIRFDDLKQALHNADIVITATASPRCIIRKELLKQVSRPFLIVDLALPRDVDEGVRELKNVELFCLEDLEVVIKANRRKKEYEAKKAKEIIDQEVPKLWNTCIGLEQEAVPLH